MRAYERLVRYAQVATAAVEDAGKVPSSEGQLSFARMLAEELGELGAKDVYVDEHAYVYARVPASPGHEDRPCVGFLAHLDTIPDFPGDNVRPRVIENYDGGDVILSASGRVLSPKEFPHLTGLKGIRSW